MVKSILISSLITIVLIVLCEGGASLVLGVDAARDSSGRPAVLERVHTEYDPELGWVNLPSFFEADMYGEGVYLRTNAARFRSDIETPATVPPGKIRIICAGDSFTLGYGVSNDEAWCNRLSQLDPRIDSVNMGQGGYGIDQAYLWYKRDGTAIQHDILVFAFINTDFDRMKSSLYHGYGKPLLAEVDGELRVTNIPISDSYLSRWMAEAGGVLTNFRTFELLGRIASRLTRSQQLTAEAEAQNLSVVSAIMDDLQDIAASEGATPIIVFLPTFGGEFEIERTRSRRESVRAAAAAKGMVFLDLVQRSTEMFDGGHIPIDPRHGHYSVPANLSVAQELLAILTTERLIPSAGDEREPELAVDGALR
jgi:hypothetical protein